MPDVLLDQPQSLKVFRERGMGQVLIQGLLKGDVFFSCQNLGGGDCTPQVRRPWYALAAFFHLYLVTYFALHILLDRPHNALSA